MTTTKKTQPQKQQQRKPTNAQLERRLEKAVMHIDRTRDTKEVYFADRGLRVVVTQDEAVIATNFHNHVFLRMTSNGISLPYTYTNSIVDIALSLADDIRVKDNMGMSFTRMMDTLEKDVTRTTDHLVCWLWDKWVFNINMPLYDIDSNSGSSFITFFRFLCNTAFTDIILGEKPQGMTTHGFINLFFDKVREFTKDLDDSVVWEAMSDEERMEKEIEAMGEAATEEAMKDIIEEGGKGDE